MRELTAGQADDLCELISDRAGRSLMLAESLTFYANSPVGWAEEVFVRHPARGCGAGRDLMSAFERWAAGHACVLVALAASRAAAFYRARGYEESAVYFRKALDDQGEE